MDECFLPRYARQLLADFRRQVGFVKHWSPLIWPGAVVDHPAREVRTPAADHPPEHLIRRVDECRLMDCQFRDNSGAVM